MTARTIVGSGPRRRPLPLGREAVERALRMCKFWKQDEVVASSFAASATEPAGEPSDRRFIGFPHDWLPVSIIHESPEQLRERLRGCP
jgi:hypothetical protein